MRIRVIDAFTDRPFTGNPAAVCLMDRATWPDTRWMQQVAAEMNLAETAFAYPLTGSAGAEWALRWFTPTVEVDLCGHATLATAHVLRSDGRSPRTVRFSSRSGVLVARTNDDGTIMLDFPAASVTESPAPSGLSDALDATPDTVHGTGALGDLLTVFGDEKAIHGLVPDLTALAGISRREGIRAIIATAPAADPRGEYDFVSRVFAPAVGVPEDPVTGSAHTALAPYWSDRLGRDSLTGLQASARTGIVHTTVHGDRVHLTGRAVTVLDGTFSPRVLEAECCF
ncbi:MAG: PhzF family phenazine biosynthesis protein [Pseudonocardiales bacterium]|nr:PhzF family phenazine biosynthesis protein [Pseudonocardiales bacterium]MBV9650222.1 PhzF family phenazine biosynthesis protein [Pseudonocardiales bacterium]